MPTEREIRLDPVLQRRQPDLLEPVPRGPGERPARDAGERLSAPQIERVTQPRGARRRVLGRQCVAPLRAQSLEPLEIELLWCDLQHVAGRMRGDARTPLRIRQRPPQPRHQRLQVVARRPRRPLAPQLVDQPVRRDRLARVQQQRRQQSALLRPERHRRPRLCTSRGPRIRNSNTWSPRATVPAGRQPVICPPSARCQRLASAPWQARRTLKGERTSCAQPRRPGRHLRC